MSQIIYSGPGKVYFNAKSFHAQGENGQVKLSLEQKTAAVAQAELGRASETFEDAQVKVAVTPFDDYSLLATLYPKNLGISAPTLTGALKIGAYAHDNSFVTSAGSSSAVVPLYVWCADGSEYFLVRGAITKHPDIMLGASTPLFGSCEFTCIGDSADPTTPLLPGASGYLFAATPMSGLLEPAGSGGTANADPDASFAWTNFVRERWTGKYGAISGTTITPITGFGDVTPMESEDSWTISVNAKYSPIYVQKILKHMKLDSVEVVAKCKLVGPTHSQILAQLLARASGDRMANLTNGLQLTSAGTSKKITLMNCELKGAGITTGGTTVRAGEVGFVSAYTFTTGAPNPILTFA